MTEETTTPRPAPQANASPPAPSRWWRLARRTLLVVVAGYALAVAGVWIWLRMANTESWAITFLLFGPRGFIAIPMIVLLPAAVVINRRLLWPLAVTALVVVGPILGFEPHFVGQDAPSELRVMTCNLDNAAYDVGALGNVIQRERPDVVALQETKVAPPAFVWPEGWHFMHEDELLVASRYPIVKKEVSMRFDVTNKPVTVRCVIQMPNREVQFFVLHLLTVRSGLEAALNRRAEGNWLAELKKALHRQAMDSQDESAFVRGFRGPKIVVGDFNLPVESPIYRREWSPLENAFSTAGLGFGFSKITEVDGWVYGTRIDHLLYTPPWRCVRSWLGGDVGSDHQPVLADFVFE